MINFPCGINIIARLTPLPRSTVVSTAKPKVLAKDCCASWAWLKSKGGSRKASWASSVLLRSFFTKVFLGIKNMTKNNPTTTINPAQNKAIFLFENIPVLFFGFIELSSRSRKLTPLT